MSFEVEPISDTTFGARVTSLKLAAIDEATFADLYQTWLAYALLISPLSSPARCAWSAPPRNYCPYRQGS